MKSKSIKIPAIIIAIGFVVAIAACFLTCITQKPTITEYDFNYSATYKLNGETKTLEGVYRCLFESTGEGTEPLERYYEGFYPSNPSESNPPSHVIARQGDLELHIEFIFTADYLMGDSDDEEYDAVTAEPYLVAYDKEGIAYEDLETIESFNAELISWETPKPIDNSFVFAGFSGLHDESMMAMLLVGILVIIACIIFVKRDKSILYKALDKFSVVLNFIIALVAMPFITLVVWLMQLYVSGDEFIYQADLCVPAITAFTIAASIALRRRGFRKAGFFIQFVGPALFVLLIILETVFGR